MTVEWRPLGLHPVILGVLLLGVSAAMFEHARQRQRASTSGPPGRLASLLFYKRIRLRRRAPFLAIEDSSSGLKHLGIDGEIYWAIAFAAGGIGALLAPLLY